MGTSCVQHHLEGRIVKTVKRKDITLEEEQEFVSFEQGPVATHWLASFYGNASTGENVQMSRASASAGEALLLLTEALAEQGYEVR